MRDRHGEPRVISRSVSWWSGKSDDEILGSGIPPSEMLCPSRRGLKARRRQEFCLTYVSLRRDGEQRAQGGRYVIRQMSFYAIFHYPPSASPISLHWFRRSSCSKSRQKRATFVGFLCHAIFTYKCLLTVFLGSESFASGIGAR